MVSPAADAGATDPGSQLPSTPRQKIDLQKLRENMDSFRSLSTQSVEKAIVHSTLKRERHNINGRIMLSVVLGTMTVFLAIANFKGVINHVVTVWICLAATVVSVAELLRKMSQIRSKCRETLQPDIESRGASRRNAENESANSVADLTLNPAATVPESKDKTPSIAATPSSQLSQIPVTGSLPTADRPTTSSGNDRLSDPGDSMAAPGGPKAGAIEIRGVESLSAAEELLRSISRQGTQVQPQASSKSAAPRARYTENDGDEESQYFEL